VVRRFAVRRRGSGVDGVELLAGRVLGIVTPKGRLFVSREQLLDVLIEARRAGATEAELPYTVVAGSVRR